MTQADAYATVEEYRAYAGKIDAGRDEVVADQLEGMSRYLEGCLGGRHFNKDDVASVRRYNPPTTDNVLQVEPIASLSGLSVVVDQNAAGSFVGLTPLATTDYEAWPLNAAEGPEAEPYTQLVIPSWASSSMYYWGPTARVQVTAIHGWPAVPRLIKMATIELTDILRRGPWAQARFGDMGEYVGTDSRARSIVHKLAEKYGHGIVVA